MAIKMPTKYLMMNKEGLSQKNNFCQKYESKNTIFINKFIIGVIIFSSIIVISIFGIIPKFIILLYTILSFMSFLRYGIDKKLAKKSYCRTAESSLLLIDLLGGWFGGLLAQRVFRHKVSKQSYQIKYWTIVIINLIALVSLIYFGITEEIRFFCINHFR